MAMTATAMLSLGPTVLAVTPIFLAGADGAVFRDTRSLGSSEVVLNFWRT